MQEPGFHSVDSERCTGTAISTGSSEKSCLPAKQTCDFKNICNRICNGRLSTALYHLYDPIDKPIYHTCTHTIHDHRPGDGERWERRRWRIKRPERVAAVGEGRWRTAAKDIRRAPQQENIFAPTPNINPSACVQLGPIYSCSLRTQFRIMFTLSRQYCIMK